MCDLVVRARRALKAAIPAVAILIGSAVLLLLLGPSPSDQVAADSCTVFAVSKDDTTFLASNED